MQPKTNIEALLHRLETAIGSKNTRHIGRADMQFATVVCADARVPRPKNDEPKHVHAIVKAAVDALAKQAERIAKEQQALDAEQGEADVAAQTKARHPEDTIESIGLNAAQARALEAVEITTVGDVRLYDEQGPGLDNIPGIGPAYANRIRALVGLPVKPAA